MSRFKATTLGRSRLISLFVAGFLAAILPGATHSGAALPDPNGLIVFSATGPDDRDVFTMNSDGSNPTPLTKGEGEDGQPVWSPDGRQIAFTSARDGNHNIYVMSADGSAQMPLTDDPGTDHFPTWSPDGAKIAFVSNREGNANVFVMNADGSGQRPLTDDPETDSEPAWSPDGTKIAFASTRDGSRNIYLMNADGLNEIPLTDDPATDRDPAWSPDASKIAFGSTRDGEIHIYVMDADGANERPLTVGSDTELQPAWSSDGSKIAFSRARDLGSDIWTMNADGSVQRMITDGMEAAHPDWQPLPVADLAVAMGAQPAVAKRGRPVTYTISVINSGPSNALGVVVTDTLPPESRFVSARPSQGSCVTPPTGQTGTVTCSLGFLANSASATTQVVVTLVTKKASISNTARVTSSTPDPNPGNNSATISTPVR